MTEVKEERMSEGNKERVESNTKVRKRNAIEIRSCCDA